MSAWLAFFRKRWAEPPPSVETGRHRFYVAATYGYPCGFVWHFVFIGLFWWVGARPLALLNVGATVIWALALLLHLSGKLRSAVVLAALEIIVHAAFGVALIGWDTGFQLYILAMAAVVFFAPLGRLSWNAALAALNAAVFAGLHYAFVDATPRITLTPWVVDALYYGNALSTFFVISLSAATYDRAATRAETALGVEKAKSEEMAGLLRRMFGRYLSPEVMNALIENPASLELGGEKRRVTIMMTDLRGFTALSERLAPEQVVGVLNGYFEVMVEVITRYQGTINEIIGDALLVFFGAPQDTARSDGGPEDESRLGGRGAGGQGLLRQGHPRWGRARGSGGGAAHVGPARGGRLPRGAAPLRGGPGLSRAPGKIAGHYNQAEAQASSTMKTVNDTLSDNIQKIG